MGRVGHRSAVLVGVAAAALAAAPAAHARIGLRLVASGLAQPIYAAQAPGHPHRLFVVEKGGKIVIFRRGRRLRRPFLDISGLVSTGGEQGLLSMAFDPQYARTRRFFVDYTNRAGNTRVVSYRASRSNQDVAATATRHVLLRVHQPYPNHNGGQLQFRPGGHRLFVSLGDGGSEGDPNLYGQNTHTRLAKILSLRIGVAHPRPRVYAYGLRNPWRFSFDRVRGGIWIGDVGQNRWEEIDHLRRSARPGANFGWSYYEGRHVFKRQPIDRSRLVFPVREYAHNPGGNCAVTGGYVYRGRISSLWGYYLYADFCSGRIWKLRTPKGRPHLMQISGRVSHIDSFGQGAHGRLYVVSLDGSVYRIVHR